MSFKPILDFLLVRRLVEESTSAIITPESFVTPSNKATVVAIGDSIVRGGVVFPLSEYVNRGQHRAYLTVRRRGCRGGWGEAGARQGCRYEGRGAERPLKKSTNILLLATVKLVILSVATMSNTAADDLKYILNPSDMRRDGRPSRAELEVIAGVVDAHTIAISDIGSTQAKMTAIVWGIVQKLGITPEELQGYCNDMAAQVKAELEKKRDELAS